MKPVYRKWVLIPGILVGALAGIVFATAITLFLVPSLYILQIDGFARARKITDWLFDRQSARDASETA